MPAISATRQSGTDMRSRTRSRTRRAGESAYGLLLLARQLAVAGVVLLILGAGVWGSWGTAQHVMLSKGREHGTMTVAHCSDEKCTGSYAPGSPGSQPRDRVVLGQSVGTKKGSEVAVAVKPGTDEVVRSGASGLFRAWIPLGGALLLASVVIAGGLRMHRTAWTTGLAGAALLVGAFVTL